MIAKNFLDIKLKKSTQIFHLVIIFYSLLLITCREYEFKEDDGYVFLKCYLEYFVFIQLHEF